MQENTGHTKDSKNTTEKDEKREDAEELNNKQGGKKEAMEGNKENVVKLDRMKEKRATYKRIQRVMNP